jgi:hypothetical protein
MTPTRDIPIGIRNPETTGVIHAYLKGDQVFHTLATDVVVEGETIWFTEVVRVEKGRGHTVAQARGRHQYVPRKGYTYRFVSLVERPDLAPEFGDLYGFQYAVSECE